MFVPGVALLTAVISVNLVTEGAPKCDWKILFDSASADDWDGFALWLKDLPMRRQYFARRRFQNNSNHLASIIQQIQIAGAKNSPNGIRLVAEIDRPDTS